MSEQLEKLKAEVGVLLDDMACLKDENAMLRKEVERLRKLINERDMS